MGAFLAADGAFRQLQGNRNHEQVIQICLERIPRRLGRYL